MTEYRTLDDVTIEYFTIHPDEIEAFLTESFADYAQDGDSAALWSALALLPTSKEFLL